MFGFAAEVIAAVNGELVSAFRTESAVVYEYAALPPRSNASRAAVPRCSSASSASI